MSRQVLLLEPFESGRALSVLVISPLGGSNHSYRWGPHGGPGVCFLAGSCPLFIDWQKHKPGPGLNLSSLAASRVSWMKTEMSLREKLPYRLLTYVPKACAAFTKTSSNTFFPVLLFEPLFCFPPFSIPHLECSPDVETAEGEIACLAIRSRWGAVGCVEKMLERH